MCITATRTGQVCAPSARDVEPEQNRPGTCGACEFVRAAAEEKKALPKAKAKAEVVGSEVVEEGETKKKKTRVEKSLPLRGKGRAAPVRQSTRLQNLTRR
jgi:hypothetical protein